MRMMDEGSCVAHILRLDGWEFVAIDDAVMLFDSSETIWILFWGFPFAFHPRRGNQKV